MKVEPRCDVLSRMSHFFISILIMELQELVERSWAIRQAYHELEVKHHDFKWTVGRRPLGFI